MKIADIAQIVAEVMDGIIAIVYMTEQRDGEAIPLIQEATQVVQEARFGSSISLLSLSVMVSMNYSEQSYYSE